MAASVDARVHKATAASAHGSSHASSHTSSHPSRASSGHSVHHSAAHSATHTAVVAAHGHGRHSTTIVGRHGHSAHLAHGAPAAHGTHAARTALDLSIRHGHHAVAAEPAEKSKEGSDIDDSQAQAQAAAEAQPRLRNYSLLGNAYGLYDEGVNERLKGNYGLATDKLTEAAKLIDQASSNERNGQSSTMAAMVFYELGLSAEADNDLSLARDSFVHAVKAKPGYVEAYMHLVNVLATGGNLRQANNWLNDGLREVPNDGRLKALQTKLSSYMGDSANSAE